MVTEREGVALCGTTPQVKPFDRRFLTQTGVCDCSRTLCQSMLRPKLWAPGDTEGREEGSDRGEQVQLHDSSLRATRLGERAEPDEAFGLQENLHRQRLWGLPLSCSCQSGVAYDWRLIGSGPRRAMCLLLFFHQLCMRETVLSTSHVCASCLFVPFAADEIEIVTLCGRSGHSP